MKIGIIYATKGGTTRECAALLSKYFCNHDVALLEIGKDEIDLDAFEFVVVGFPIRMASAQKNARRLKN